MRLNEDLQMPFEVGRDATLIVIFFLFQRKGKKNNQSSVSEADREIPTLGSTDNAGNSGNLVSVYPRVGISRSASETDDRFYLSALWLMNEETFDDTSCNEVKLKSCKNPSRAQKTFKRNVSQVSKFRLLKLHQ